MRPSVWAPSPKQLQEEALLELASLDLSQLEEEAKIHHCLALRGVSRCRREVHFTLISCGHASLCADCSRQSSTCPVCRTPLPPTHQQRFRKRLYYRCIGAGLVSKNFSDDDKFHERSADKKSIEDTELSRLFSLFDVALENNLVSMLCQYISDGVSKQIAASTDLNYDEFVGFKEWCGYSFQKIVQELLYKQEEMGMKPSLLLKCLSQLSGLAIVLETLMSSFKSAKNVQLDEIHLLLDNILRLKQDLTSHRHERTPPSHEFMAKRLFDETYEEKSSSTLFRRLHKIQSDFLTNSAPGKLGLPKFSANRPHFSSGSAIHIMDRTQDISKNDQFIGNESIDYRLSIKADSMAGVDNKLAHPPLGEATPVSLLAQKEIIGPTAPTLLQLKVFVDEKTNRVIYAQCDRLMVDVLFSFLTTPVGALVRRSDGYSGLGLMDSLYKSVEKLETDHFETLKCRELLLRPSSADGFAHHRLKLLINDIDKQFPYGCRSLKCPKYSLFKGTICECGLEMTGLMPLAHPRPLDSDLVFIRKDVADSFIITDNLFICPSSDEVKQGICLAASLGDESISSDNLSEQIFYVDDFKIVKLFKRSMQSNSPLTDIFFESENRTEPKPMDLSMEFLQLHFIETKAYRETQKLSDGMIAKVTSWMLSFMFGRYDVAITLFHDEKRVVCAKVGGDFVNLLFSFLTFPFGSILAAVEGQYMGCLDNLYQVVDRFVASGFCFRRSLLNPPIACHHDYPNHLLKIGGSRVTSYHTICPRCDFEGIKLPCPEKSHFHFEWKPINPKRRENHITEIGGGYVRSSGIFLIMSDLHVEPIYDLQDTKFSMGLEEKHVILTSKKALDFLLAVLTLKDPLTHVFLEAHSN